MKLWDDLGAHVTAGGTRFAVWAPNAAAVSVIGDWNGWRPGVSPLAREGDVWRGEVAGVGRGALYKFHIQSQHGKGYEVAKADPFARRMEEAPGTASIVWDAPYTWGDAGWMTERAERARFDAPISIYEVHLGSWRRVPEQGHRSLGYREITAGLVDHVTKLGFTHVELMPITEHPFFGSWGYETTGYFAATSRYGAPEDLKALIDALHQAGVGVILDWVPGHFPTDEHALVYFDGTPLYEHPDRRLGFHPEWNTAIFDYGRTEVREFLIASAQFWLEEFHLDGLRVDGVASMLYRDYGRKAGEWEPNRLGGREYLEAADFLRQLTTEVASAAPDSITIAEESTAWPGVTAPVAKRGLGFGFKWDLGWMHDTLKYLQLDPIHRSHHHRELTMRGLYMHTEQFVLPLGHDEVVYGKRSLLAKMPGDRWQQFANLRLLFAHQWAQPGKKLLFMGGEFGQWNEWNHDASLDWHLTADALHGATMLLVGSLNALYRTEPALHELDGEPQGFKWLDADDAAHSILAYERIGLDADERIACVFNFTPVVREGYRIGVNAPGRYRELLNTDATGFGGSGVGNLGEVTAVNAPAQGRPYSLPVSLPPLGAVWFKRA